MKPANMTPELLQELAAQVFGEMRGLPHGLDLAEIANEAFVKLQALPEHRRVTPRFVSKVMRNLVRDHWRRRRSMAYEPSDLAYAGPDPSERAALSERADLVAIGLGRLSEAHRRPLEMAGAGLSPKEIARVLREKAETVRVRLHRARHQLHREMTRCATKT